MNRTFKRMVAAGVISIVVGASWSFSSASLARSSGDSGSGHTFHLALASGNGTKILDGNERSYHKEIFSFNYGFHSPLVGDLSYILGSRIAVSSEKGDPKADFTWQIPGLVAGVSYQPRLPVRLNLGLMAYIERLFGLRRVSKLDATVVVPFHVFAEFEWYFSEQVGVVLGFFQRRGFLEGPEQAQGTVWDFELVRREWGISLGAAYRKGV